MVLNLISKISIFFLPIKYGVNLYFNLTGNVNSVGIVEDDFFSVFRLLISIINSYKIRYIVERNI